MKKLIFLIASTLTSNLFGMNHEELAEMKQSIDLLTTLTQGSTIDSAQKKERYEVIVGNIVGLTQNLQAQDQEIKVLRNTLQCLINRVDQLEQQQVTKPDSTAKKIFSHPLTWLGLIAVYYLASKYYERRHKKEKDIEDTDDSNTDTMVTDPVQ